MISPLNFLSDAVVQALGWTLVHSLWQGAAAALLLWFFLPRLPRARQRYRAAYAALLCTLAASIVTFTWLYASFPKTTAGSGAPLPPLTTESTGFQAFLTQVATPAPDFWQMVSERLEAWHPVIVTVWLAGFGFFLLQLAGGLHFMHRLRHRRNRPATSEWQDRLDLLAARLGQTRPVRLLESALAHTPMALGYFKPLILLPVGLVNQLSPAEVEAILAHELAHIARRDWLFNLLQALVEALFYFHPAVWWISATVRAERENCCDDTAVALTGNRLLYAKTLVRLQDLARAGQTPALALGLDGAAPRLRRRPLLLERIKRILHQPQPSSSIMEKSIAIAIVLALLTLLTVRAAAPPAFVEAIREIAEAPGAWFAQAPEAPQAPAAEPDTLKPQRRRKIVSDDGDQRVEMDIEGNKITRLNIDGKDIPASEFEQYEELTDEVYREAAPPPPPPGVWAVPPVAPRAPREPWGFAAPPSPPTPAPPPFGYGHGSSISTDTDDDGNTVIRVERGGEPMVIKVKDGKVYVDGAEVKDGETLDLNEDDSQMFWNDGQGQSFWIDGNQLHLGDHPDAVLAYPAPPAELFDEEQLRSLENLHILAPNCEVYGLENLRGLSDEEYKKARDEALRQLELEQKELRKQMKEQSKEWKKNSKEWEKQQREYRKAIQQSQRAMLDAQRTQMRTQEQAREELLRANLERSQARVYDLRERARRDNESSVGNVLKNEMIEDKLLKDPDNYSFELSSKKLTIDGKKQPAEVHEKYLNLYRQRTGKDLGDGKFQWTWNTD